MSILPYPPNAFYPVGTRNDGAKFVEESPNTIGFYVKQTAPSSSDFFSGKVITSGEIIEMTLQYEDSTSMRFYGEASVKDYSVLAEQLSQSLLIYPYKPVNEWFKVPFVTGFNFVNPSPYPGTAVRIEFPTLLDFESYYPVFAIKCFDTENGSIGGFTSTDKPTVPNSSTVYHYTAPTTGFMRDYGGVEYPYVADGTFGPSYVNSYTHVRLTQYCPLGAIYGIYEYYNKTSNGNGSWGRVEYRRRRAGYGGVPNKSFWTAHWHCGG